MFMFNIYTDTDLADCGEVLQSLGYETEEITYRKGDISLSARNISPGLMEALKAKFNMDFDPRTLIYYMNHRAGAYDVVPPESDLENLRQIKNKLNRCVVVHFPLNNEVNL